MMCLYMYIYIFFPFQSKVGNVSFSVGPSQDELKKVHQVSFGNPAKSNLFYLQISGIANIIFVLLSVSYHCKRPLCPFQSIKN